jgi:hypothetical protein
VSLPGGKLEEGDKDDKATAIIGLPPDFVSVATVLEVKPSYFLISGS